MVSTFRVSRRRVATAIISLAIVSCKSATAPSGSNPAADTYAASLAVNLAQMTKMSEALYTQDLVVGTGASATAGKTLGVTYTGWLVNGTLFDSNVGKAAFSFPLGIRYVIAGWDQGVVGMKVGGKRRLIIGSTLGYGSSGSGSIPPNSTLVFDITLLSAQ
jgi:peptidylprolyl isomerase